MTGTEKYEFILLYVERPELVLVSISMTLNTEYLVDFKMAAFALDDF